MIWLCFGGHEGQSNSTQWDTIKVSRVIWLARDCIVDILNIIRKVFTHWPNAEERKEIAVKVEEKLHITNCSVMQDDTLLRLRIEPECDDAANYHGRFCTYSITVNVINDDER